MNDKALNDRILKVLYQVAPDAEGEHLDVATAFRDQMDFDSMDALNFAIGLSKEFGIDIPELDYPKLASLKGCSDYLGKNKDSGTAAS